MKIIITDRNGNSPERAVKTVLGRVLERLNRTGKIIQQSLLWSTRNHFAAVYPGSSHYSPDRVAESGFRNGTVPAGKIDVDVPGVTRAYRDLDIRPKLRKSLTVPLHRSAYGRRAGEFDDLFVVKKKNGKAFLARNSGGQLTFMYALVKRVFQKRDRRLMPSDRTFQSNICSRISAYLDSQRITG